MISLFCYEYTTWVSYLFSLTSLFLSPYYKKSWWNLHEAKDYNPRKCEIFNPHEKSEGNFNLREKVHAVGNMYGWWCWWWWFCLRRDPPFLLELVPTVYETHDADVTRCVLFSNNSENYLTVSLVIFDWSFSTRTKMVRQNTYANLSRQLVN